MTKIQVNVHQRKPGMVMHHVFQNCMNCDGHGGYIVDSEDGECEDCPECIEAGKCPNCMHDGFDRNSICNNCTFAEGDTGPFLPIVFDARPNEKPEIIEQKRQILKVDYLKQIGRYKLLPR